MRAGARVLVQRPPVPALRDDGVLGLAVLRMFAFVLSVVTRKTYNGFGVAHVTVLLLPRVARVEVALEVFRVTDDTVPVILLVGQRAQRAVVEVVSRCAVVERERLVRTRVAANIREAIGGQRAAAPRALRPPGGPLAGHEKHARGGVKL